VSIKSRNAILIVVAISFVIIYKGYKSGHFSVALGLKKASESQSSRASLPPAKEYIRQPSSIAGPQAEAISDFLKHHSEYQHDHEKCLRDLNQAVESLKKARLEAGELEKLEAQVRIDHEEWRRRAIKEFEDYAATEDLEAEPEFEFEVEEDFFREMQSHVE
jgi:hypothetical protein